MKWAALALFLPAAALAEERRLTADEFEARVTGRTIVYAQEGQIWGREQYLSGRRVIWVFEGQECRPGIWWDEAEDLVCFSYEEGAAPICWWFYDRDGVLLARAQGDPEGMPLAELDSAQGGMPCAGPWLGS